MRKLGGHSVIRLAVLLLLAGGTTTQAMWVPHSQELTLRWGPSSTYNLSVAGDQLDGESFYSVEYSLRSVFIPVSVGYTYVVGSVTYSATAPLDPGSFNVNETNPSGRFDSDDDYRLHPGYTAFLGGFRLIRPLLTDHTELYGQIDAGFSNGAMFQNHGSGSRSLPFLRGTYFEGWGTTWRVGGGMNFTIPGLDQPSYPDFPITLGATYTMLRVRNIDSDPASVVDDGTDDLDFTGMTWHMGVGIRF